MAMLTSLCEFQPHFRWFYAFFSPWYLYIWFYQLFCSRDLFGGDEVEVVPHHSSKHHSQGTIEIIVKLSSVIIKSHAKFDIFPKPIESDSDALIQFHTTTTETISLQKTHGADAAVSVLREKKTNMTGWRTLAIRPAYYERVVHQ